MRFTLAVAFLTFAFFSTELRSEQATRVITYSWPETMQDDKRGDYPVALLRLAIEKSGNKFVLQPSKSDLAQQRTIHQVATGTGTDIVWTFTTKSLEQQLLPIRIPIDRGLLGWRLLLIRKNEQSRFQQVTDKQQLAQLIAVQGHEWPDVNVLKSNDFKVITGANYSGLFNMLKLGRADYFPRAISEIQFELETHSNNELAIAESIVLYYPAPMYFFVNPKDIALAQAIEHGLRTAITDGSFKQLFLAHFAEHIDKAELSNKLIISLENSELSAETPLQQKELWFEPNKRF